MSTRAARFVSLALALVLVTLAGFTASCGSVASRAVDSGAGGSSPEVDAGGTGGAAAPTDAGGGASGGSGGSGAPGSGGTSGSGGAPVAGTGGSNAVDAGIFARGTIAPLGPSPAAAGSILVRRQRLGSTLVCSGSICASGGLIPR